MKTDKLQDALTGVNEDYVADAHAETRARGKKPMVRAGALAACLVLVAGMGIGLSRQGVIRPPVNVTDPPIQTTTPTPETPPVTITTQPTTPDPPPQTTTALQYIVWPGDGVMGEVANEIYVPETQYGEWVRASHLMQQAIERAGENDLLAFLVVPQVSVSEAVVTEQEVLWNTLYRPAEEALAAAVQAVMAELTADGTMSAAEAEVRKYSHPDFIAARAAERAAYAELVSQRMLIMYREKGEYFEALADLGFTLLCDARDQEWRYYLAAYNAVGILAGTREQIQALVDAELDCEYLLYPAAEEGKNYRGEDWYSALDMDLPADSKLTRALLDAYEQAEGQPLRVLVQYAYFGKDYTREELDAAGAAALGMTVEEFYAARDLTAEQADQFLKVRNDLIYARPEKEEFAQRAFREGELIDTRMYTITYLAELSYDRALELSQMREVAYLCLADEYYAARSDSPVIYDVTLE